MITICFVYFRHLTLAHLEAALYSLRRQDFACVLRLVVVDNNTGDSLADIQATVDSFDFPIPVILYSNKHGDPTKTHAWSTNVTMRQAFTEWVFFCRADYLLSFNAIQKFWEITKDHSTDWDGFVTSKGSYLGTLADCKLSWREEGPETLTGLTYDHTVIDAGVWLARRSSFERVGGLNENLTAWGHAQTHFQWKLYGTGTQFHRIDDVLFHHMDHGGEKDIHLANSQLAQQGLDLKEMWSRYDGPRVY